MRKEFEFNLVYFKESGKFYTTGKVKLEVAVIGSIPHNIMPYMTEAIDKIRKMRGDGKLPGLQSGKWEYSILINCDEGFPHLLTPIKQ